VLRNIETSLRSHPRRAFLVYYLPVHREVVDRSAAFSLHAASVVNGYECRIYQHVPAAR
jgi:hypothetical protein